MGLLFLIPMFHYYPLVNVKIKMDSLSRVHLLLLQGVIITFLFIKEVVKTDFKYYKRYN